MNPLRIIARPLLAAGFISTGLDQVMHTNDHAEAARGLVETASDNIEKVPNNPELIVRLNGAALIAGGLALAAGKLPRFAALILTASMIPSTYTQHQFWAEKDPATATLKRELFIKNIALTGGALLATSAVNSKNLERKVAARATAKATKLHAKNMKLRATHAVEEAVGKVMK